MNRIALGAVTVLLTVVFVAACSTPPDAGAPDGVVAREGDATETEEPAVDIAEPQEAAIDVAGTWEGIIEYGGAKLLTVFNITRDESGAYAATTDSPDQSAYGIPVETVLVEGSRIVLTISVTGAVYEGEVDAGTMTGEWKQAGITIPLDMTRTGDAERFSRPQDPRPPYPYTVRDVTFRNETAGITLAGTLTRPDGEGPFPGVVLVTGSGPQNRDEEVVDHRPFLVWADALTRAGFAVLRYDDRGTAQSEGDFDGSTSKDFAGDAESARSYLMSLSVVDPERVGLLGHSEGSIVSAMVASGEMPGSTPTSPEVAFVVSLAGPAVPGHEVLVAQSAAFLRASGVNEDAIALSSSTNHQAYAAVMEGGDTPEAREKVSGILAGAGLNAAQIEAQLPVLFSPWYMHFLAYDPAVAIAKLSCPVLAVFGSLDFQVLATQNQEPFEAALRQAPSQRYRVELLEGKNHLFQTATTGLLDEYGKIEETLCVEVIELVTSWLVSEMM